MQIAAIIPALDPPPALAALVADLAADFPAVVVVDDGSGPGHEETFSRIGAIPGASVLRHPGNRGKGAALKTAFDHVARELPGVSGVVTADADGQHLPEDIRKVAGALAAAPDSLVLGARSFDGPVPLRSRIGNVLTRALFRVLVGRKITDTQTGLRGIPRAMISRLLRSPSDGYEFEFDMLLLARHGNVPIAEVPIRTVYLEGNRSSHFSPIFDSMRIWYVLLRSVLVSITTFVIDTIIFLLLIGGGSPILPAQAGARIVAGFFQYMAMRRAVFYSDQLHRCAFPSYAALNLGSMLAAYGSIRLLMAAGLQVMPAKIASETIIYLVNFVIMREIIFTRRGSGKGLIPLLKTVRRLVSAGRRSRGSGSRG